MRGVVLTVTIALVFSVGLGTASADRIDVRARQLRSGDYKVRLSAALYLAGKADPRAVTALTYALKHDRRSTIRRVAARSLANLLARRLPRWVHDSAIEALRESAARDRDRKVRRASRNAYSKLERSRSNSPRLSRVFVAIDTTTDRTRRLRNGDLVAVSAVLRTTMRRRAPKYSHATRAEGLPTSAELARSLSAGFYIKATVARVDVRGVRGGTEVGCQVDIRVSSWDGVDKALRMRAGEYASATGRGRVAGGSSRASVAGSTRDCVLAVVESVAERQVVPFVKRQADRRLAVR